PWPNWPMTLRIESSHEEGGQRQWSIATKKFTGENGHVKKLHAVRLDWLPPDGNGRRTMQEIPGSEFEIDADLVLLALGFLYPQPDGLVQQLGLQLDPRGNIAVDETFMASVPGVFAAGDAQRGQSLVVWALAGGRKAARSMDLYLMGKTTLPI
ncbi:MAG: FAD-dependent oxidoreductase, partial [Acidobacteria bacterium]|nr:FAD-dependent oxidoreductase [Acidobacteriota bacterium]